MDLDNDLERLLSTQKEKHPDIEIRNSIHALLAKKKKKKKPCKLDLSLTEPIGVRTSLLEVRGAEGCAKGTTGLSPPRSGVDCSVGKAVCG